MCVCVCARAESRGAARSVAIRGFTLLGARRKVARERRKLRREVRLDFRCETGGPRSDSGGSWYCTGAQLVLCLYYTVETLVLYRICTGTEVLYWRHTGATIVLHQYCAGTTCLLHP